MCCWSAQPDRVSPRGQNCGTGKCAAAHITESAGEEREWERGSKGATAQGRTRPAEVLRLPIVLVRRGMQTSDGWCKSCVVWAMWMLYVCFAMALTLGRSDGPSGQGFSSLRVESLLSKMTLEDKVGSVFCSSSASQPTVPVQHDSIFQHRA